MYWEAFIKNNLALTEEINEAIRVIKSIKLNTQKLSPEEKQDLFKQIQVEIERRNKKKHYRIYFGVSAVACVTLVFMLLRYSVFVRDHDTRQETLSAIVQDSVVNSKDIQLILADNKMITIENESDILYNEQGEIIINTSGEQIKTEKVKTSEIKLNTLIVPKGKRSNLTLSDGTKVWVNSGTILKFPAEFDEKKREVWVDGEMYIEVAKNKALPFYVNTARMMIDVVGTRFNISAYKEDQECSVVLVEGEVRVVVEDNDYRLLPDRMLSLSPENKVSTREINVYDYISWKDGLLQYSREPLFNILTRLSRYYDIEIICEEQVRDLKCNGKLVLFDNIEDVLRTIYNVIPIEYAINEKHIMITKR